jgi:NitT/TauT family transport system permease protein
MAETGRLRAPSFAPSWAPSWVREHPVAALRIFIVVTVLLVWEGLAQSGLLYRDVVPSLFKIGVALFALLTVPDLPWQIDIPWLGIATEINIPQIYWHLYATFYEIVLGMAIGGIAGLAVGILLGGSKLMQRAYEPFLYYLGPCPKIIFFPVMIMWFGVGPGSKVAMGAVSCFFPVALNVAGGMREIDKVLIRVGKSFRANTWQMVTKIYMPAMRHPIINGVRLGLGVCLIGTLLAETKLSNRGVGFLVIQAYTLFDMPLMYSLLIVLFVIAIGANALIGRLGGLDSIKRS